MSQNSTMQFTIPSHILAQELAGEVVLMNIDNEMYYSLNSVGSQIWQLLSDRLDLETAIEQLLRRFDIDEATLRQDVTQLVDELVAQGLLTVEQETV
ncbi:PqqD family protein [Oscillatoria sp. HE19RPO]|jgi:hypothetical protein|uniref:PqqD family protein n=1 Tax=Oscillatoria sp. HE19RPO TaxID=2954806 RepID=UPI0020C4F950|nr:PqqD family protein [Oscillatoria sp. HE19RPO]